MRHRGDGEGPREQMERVAGARGVRRESERSRMADLARRRVTTAFIAALARFEEAFGHLWGRGRHQDKCTDEQMRNREAWQRCRDGVLDGGNRQARLLAAELEEHEQKLIRDIQQEQK